MFGKQQKTLPPDVKMAHEAGKIYLALELGRESRTPNYRGLLRAHQTLLGKCGAEGTVAGYFLAYQDLYCGNSTFLGDNLAVVAEYGKVIEAWRLENKNTESLQ